MLLARSSQDCAHRHVSLGTSNVIKRPDSLLLPCPALQGAVTSQREKAESTLLKHWRRTTLGGGLDARRLIQKAHTWQCAGAVGRTDVVGKAEFWLVEPLIHQQGTGGENVQLM
jgi:hypothetical protein